jgi:choline dehydrogenase
MLNARSSLAAANAPTRSAHLPSGPFHAEGYSRTGAVQALVLSVVKPRSRGWVRLRNAEPTAPPRIHLGLLEHLDDLARMFEAVRIARHLAPHSALRELIADPELFPGEALDDQDEAELHRALKARVETYHHPVGTCRMGPDPTHGAVVDAQTRVHGIDALRIVDASIMPEIPSANTNLPKLMLARRVAALLRSEIAV